MKGNGKLRIPKSELRTATGAVAQLGERLVCNQEGVGSSPIGSTILQCGMRSAECGVKGTGVKARCC